MFLSCSQAMFFFLSKGRICTTSNVLKFYIINCNRIARWNQIRTSLTKRHILICVYSSENMLSDIIMISTCHYICLQCGRPGFDPWVRNISWRRTRQPLQGSCLEKPMDRGAWQLQSMGSQRVRHDWSYLAGTL